MSQLQLHRRSTFESSDGKSHESTRASGKGCCTTPMGSHIRSAWFNCWCQVFRYLDVILFFLSQPGAVVPVPGSFFFFIIIVIIFTGSEGCLAHNAAKPSVCYFCCFMMWPSCYVTRDMGVLLRPSQGTGVTVRDQGRGLMSTFYIQGGEPQACCHVVLHALPLSHRNSLAHSLMRVLAHRQCGGK